MSQTDPNAEATIPRTPSFIDPLATAELLPTASAPRANWPQDIRWPTSDSTTVETNALRVSDHTLAQELAVTPRGEFAGISY